MFSFNILLSLVAPKGAGGYVDVHVSTYIYIYILKRTVKYLSSEVIMSSVCACPFLEPFKKWDFLFVKVTFQNITIVNTILNYIFNHIVNTIVEHLTLCYKLLCDSRSPFAEGDSIHKRPWLWLRPVYDSTKQPFNQWINQLSARGGDTSQSLPWFPDSWTKQAIQFAWMPLMVANTFHCDFQACVLLVNHLRRSMLSF